MRMFERIGKVKLILIVVAINVLLISIFFKMMWDNTPTPKIIFEEPEIDELTNEKENKSKDLLEIVLSLMPFFFIGVIIARLMRWITEVD